MENAIQWAAIGNLGPLRDWVRANPTLVNERFGASQSTLLFVAARGGQLAVVKYLIEECRADVNATCMNDLTPLHGAAYAGHDYVVEYLAAHGAQLRKNSRGQTALDAVLEPCATKTEDMKKRSLVALNQFYGGSALPAAAPQSPAGNVPPAQQPLLTNLPEQVAQFLYKAGQGWSWRATQHDYILSGLHGYRYQGNTYFTPVDLFYPMDGSMAFRCRVDMNKLGGLVLSPKATDTYLDVFTGSLRLPPFLYPALQMYMEKGVTGLFEQTPPLSQRLSNQRVLQRDKSTLRSIQRQCSAFADGCFQLNPAGNVVVGSIPIPVSSVVGISLVPIQIKFIPVEVQSSPSETPAAEAPPVKPLVFVVPSPDNMVLLQTANVDPVSGLVSGLPSLSVPWNIDYLSQLLREMQDAFSKAVPIRFRGPEDSVVRPTVLIPPSAAAAEPTPSPLRGSTMTPSSLAASAMPASKPATPAAAPKSSPVSNDAGDGYLCVICMDQQKTHLVMPCRHLTFCKACAAQYKEKASKNSHLCPTCRQPIESMVEIFL